MIENGVPFQRAWVAFFFALLIIVHTPARSDLLPQVIYGEDNRHEPFEVGEPFRQISTSVAGKIAKSIFSPVGSGFVLDNISLGKRYCSSIRFSEQMMGPECTGFLVADDLLVTAGHCMREVSDCSDFYWVFDYSLKRLGDTSYASVGRDRVYQCSKVVAHKMSFFDGIDYTIVQLDRKVTGRSPLTLDFNSDLKVGHPVAVIGHPSGIPLKVTDSGTIQSNDSAYSFQTDLDEFRGNSGSPVFDATNGNVIGIVSSGQSDYVWGGDGKCKIPRICRPGDRCVLSTASRVRNLKEDLEKLLPHLFN